MSSDSAVFFKENNYLTVKNFVSLEVCNIFKQYAQFQAKFACTPETGPDVQVAETHSRYADFFAESLLVNFLPKVENATGLELLPTYSYFRAYKEGDILSPHLDRSECEISVTISFTENMWPFYLINAYKSNDKSVKEVLLDFGDALIYAGPEVVHWREKLQAQQHIQVFLHYVRKNGKFASRIYDGRTEAGQPRAKL